MVRLVDYGLSTGCLPSFLSYYGTSKEQEYIYSRAGRTRGDLMGHHLPNFCQIILRSKVFRHLFRIGININLALVQLSRKNARSSTGPSLVYICTRQALSKISQLQSRRSRLFVAFFAQYLALPFSFLDLSNITGRKTEYQVSRLILKTYSIQNILCENNTFQ